MKYKWMARMGAALLTAVMLTGCGAKGTTQSSDQSSESNHSVSSQTTDASHSNGKTLREADQKTPKQGGSVLLAVTQEPDVLDPHLAAAAGTKEILYNLYEGLVHLTTDGHFEPCLAEKYQSNDNATEFVFDIRSGVKFHDGHLLTPEDVVFSLKRIAGLLSDSQKPLISDFAVIESVDLNEKGQVVVRLHEPNADFMSYMTVAIIPKESKTGEVPLGTGPFKFADYKKQELVRIQRFDDYWRERTAYLDEVTFKIMPSADAAMVDLQAGKIDIFPYLTIDKYDLVKDQYDFIESSANMVQLWALNNDQEPFDNPLVREALNLAVDKKEIIEGVTFGRGDLLNSAMSPAMGDFYNRDLVNPGRDVEAAKALLQSSGVELPLKMTITVPGNYTIHVQTAEIIAAQLQEVGIEANIQTVDWGTWLSDVYKARKYDSTVIALTFDFCASSTVLGRYASDASRNFINFKNQRYDDLYQKAKVEVDEAKRIELYREMQRVLANEHASVFLQSPGVQTAIRKNLGGYLTYPMYVQDMYNVFYTE